MSENEVAQNSAEPHDEDRRGVKLVPSAIQEHSTRDLENCVKADLRNQIDPELLNRLRSKLKADAPEMNPDS
jgi:hypothetical protein